MMEKIIPKDMPKIESPFIRVNNEKGDYVVTPQVTEGYEWVFEDDSVLAVEKLHGTNVSIIIEEGTITSVWNRTGRVPFFNKGKGFIIKGLLESYDRGYSKDSIYRGAAQSAGAGTWAPDHGGL